jgi:hypothetical protein
MIKCPECQKEISNTSASCPNCGCPITSGANTLKQGTITQAEIYKTAFIHSVIIAIELIIYFICSSSDSTLLKNIIPCLGVYRGMFFNPILITGILCIMEFKKNTSNLNCIYKYKTMLLTWCFYAFVNLTLDCINLMRFPINSYSLSLCIQDIIITIVSIIGIFIFVKGTDLKKYISVFIVWGIYALLALGCDVIWRYDIFLIKGILTVLSSIPMGILWGVSSSKSKTIQ